MATSTQSRPASPPAPPAPSSPGTREMRIAMVALAGIAVHLVLRWLPGVAPWVVEAPLWVVLAAGVPLLWELGRRMAARQFGSDLLAGISIITAVLLREDLVAAIVVLMLSGGTALERYAVRRASAVLDALARRMPGIAHRQQEDGLREVALEEIRIGDRLVVLPHEICPVDGVVASGHGVMDESYLTGEPFLISKAPGAQVLSGAINGEAALTIEATKLPVDSRYARIMQVMRESEQARPALRRIGDRLGAWYTPTAVAVAAAGWILGGTPERFLAVMVIATPCPLLLAIPVAIISAISLAARRAIVIKNPASIEQVSACRTLIFDKTGTLTYGHPELTGVVPFAGVDETRLLGLTASLERYSKHPLAGAVIEAAQRRGLPPQEVVSMAEKPGQGLQGTVDGVSVTITGRKALPPTMAPQVPPQQGGLECLVLLDGRYAGLFRFHDEPRRESHGFIHHLGPKHAVERVVLLSGDRESEVRYMAEKIGISRFYSGKSPEEKVAIVREETQRAKTLYVGDGINDAPAMIASTVGIAFGQNSDITAEAADAVILEASLGKVDELLHIGRRMRRIALQSAIGGMALSLIGMLLAVSGLLPPLAGAIAQEGIDLLAVLNALRAAMPGGDLTDFPQA